MDPPNIDFLLNNLKNAEYFTLVGLNKKARIVSVYDADTVDALIFLHDRFYKFKLRLSGIDTPEIKPLKKIENRDLHVSCAKKCKEYLSSLILNKIVNIECLEFDKYGRLLVNIIHDNMNINDHLISKKYAKRYEGKTKCTWAEEDLKTIQES